MTELQKERIDRMRVTGTGYSQIAKALGLSVNSVKSYCQRNQLGGVRVDGVMSSTNDTGYCLQCERKLPQNGLNNHRKFCSDHCRMAWWKAHANRLSRKAIYRITCQGCNRAFESYGNKNRKYCSHQCYIRTRFHGDTNE